MPEKLFAPGDRIFKEGDASDAAYLIVSGRVEILKKAPHGDVRLAVLEPGQTFGEMGLFDSAPRSASARAMEETVVSVIAEQELQQLLLQCPATLRPILNAVFERLRNTNSRLSEKERSSTIVECDYDEIHVVPDCEAWDGVVAPQVVSVATLPYRIGGFAKEGQADHGVNNDLHVPCEGPPLVVSRRHVILEVRDKTVFVVDRGSRFGTMLNDRFLGKAQGAYSVPLEKGEHLLRLGGKHSPYRLKLICR